MAKLCPRGKAAAKRKFKVYPSAYANAYASKICAGKIKDPSGVKRKDFRGSKAEGGRIGLKDGTKKKSFMDKFKLINRPKSDSEDTPLKKFKSNEDKKKKRLEDLRKELGMKGGGLMEATARLKRQGLGMGGRVCKIAKRGMNRDAIGKNS